MKLDKDFYTVKEAAHVLGLTEMTVRKYCRDGQIAAVRTGNRYRIPAAALESWEGVARAERSRANPSYLDPGEGLEGIMQDLTTVCQLLTDVMRRLNLYIFNESENKKDEG